MATKTIAGKTVQVNDEGFMTNPAEWTKEIAVEMAKEEGIAELTAAHWTVIDFCRQSAGASGARWLGPSIEETLDQCAEGGIRHVLIVPIGFISDHVEILFDIDIEAKARAQALGMRLERTETLNSTGTFFQGLAQIVLDGGNE